MNNNNKKVLGVSVYPRNSSYEEIKKYLIKAKECGFNKIFTSMFYLDNPSLKVNLPKYLKFFKLAKSLGYYIIADVSQSVINLLNEDREFTKLKSFGIDCLRIDSPLIAFDVAAATYNDIDIQINSSNDTAYIDDVLSHSPNLSRISVMHNFYPKPFTGLNYQFFERCNKKYKSFNVRNAAFITSQVGAIGPQPITDKLVKLPTIEKHRNLPIDKQAEDLLKFPSIEEIFIGNYPASDEELESLKKFAKPYKPIKHVENKIRLKFIPISGVTTNENTIIKWSKHFRRGDLTEGFIRSCMSRVEFANLNIPPKNSNQLIFKKGDVLLVNNTDVHYKGELWIVTNTKLKLDAKSFNLVGTIDKKDLKLFSKINSWTRFVLY